MKMLKDLRKYVNGLKKIEVLARPSMSESPMKKDQDGQLVTIQNVDDLSEVSQKNGFIYEPSSTSIILAEGEKSPIHVRFLNYKRLKSGLF